MRLVKPCRSTNRLPSGVSCDIAAWSSLVRVMSSGTAVSR